ncbi:MAG: porin family protein [Chitinophagaceae bacterium]
MKQVLSILGLSLLMAGPIAAQSTSFGLKAGLNVASLETSGTDLNGKAGLYVGGLAHIHISPHFALQPELMYSMQGGQRDNQTVKLNYVNIPFLAQYMANDGFRLQTGPQLGILAAAKSKTGDVEVDIKDNLSGTDFSWVFGAGYLFPQGWGIDGRFNLGLSNVDDNDNSTVKNRVFQIGVFYQFPTTGRSSRSHR